MDLILVNSLWKEASVGKIRSVGLILLFFFLPRVKLLHTSTLSLSQWDSLCMFSVTADYFQEDCHVAGTGGMEARIKAPVPCSTCFCTNTSWQKECCRIVWVLPQCIQQRLHSFEHQWEEGKKNKMRAAQGRFPPPSFSWATALRTQVCSPSNPSSASSCSQSTKPMVHKPLSDCANAHSWQKQRTGRETVNLKGSLTFYNPVTNTCHHNLCIPDNSLIQRPPELIDMAMTGFESGIASLTEPLPSS